MRRQDYTISYKVPVKNLWGDQYFQSLSPFESDFLIKRNVDVKWVEIDTGYVWSMAVDHPLNCGSILRSYLIIG